MRKPQYFKKVEDEVVKPRDKKGHPISKLLEVDPIQYRKDLEIIKMSGETRLITDEQIPSLMKMLKYATNKHD